MKKYIIGIDEVGRGPLAGPVAIGAVCATQEIIDSFKEIKESKQLSEKKRELWNKKINDAVSNDLKLSIAFVDANIIDEIGIANAIKEALSSALKGLDVDPNDCHVKLDGGLHAPPEYKSQETIIRGDASETIIAMASVVAKVKRDNYMVSISDNYAEYGFAKHKGYGTKAHTEAIEKYGLSDQHRRTFCKNFF